jgi:hypothetical protein
MARSGQAFMYRGLPTSFQEVDEGFHERLRRTPYPVFLLLGSSSSISVGFLYHDFVFCSWMQWPRLMLLSARADFSGFSRRMWC